MKKRRSFIGVALALAVAMSALVGGGARASAADIINEGCAVSAAELGGIQVSSRLWELLFGEEGEEAAVTERMLIPGGTVFGARLRREHPAVEDPSGVAGLQCGDVIISANGEEISTGEELSELVRSSGGGTVALHILRGERELDLSATPHSTAGEYSLGITLREMAAGIGTVTYIDPSDGSFGGLGHGICDAESKNPIEIVGGRVTGALLGGIQKGEAGKPGELSGILTDKSLGEVYLNTPSGVFGRLDGEAAGEAIPVGRSAEVHEGDAEIISTVKNGKTLRYSVKIFDIDRSGDGTKCFKIKVTDPALLKLTGGIVKGMSGSPILQDGKLVGAVTHVLVANPTEGYGIFIENMLSAAQSQVVPKAA